MKVRIIALAGVSNLELIRLNGAGRNLSLDKAYTLREAALKATFKDDRTAMAAQIMMRTIIGGENLTPSSNTTSEPVKSSMLTE
jgi:hypothetical protein